jgi:hypothetical protein
LNDAAPLHSCTHEICAVAAIAPDFVQTLLQFVDAVRRQIEHNLNFRRRIEEQVFDFRPRPDQEYSRNAAGDGDGRCTRRARKFV